MVHAYTEAVSSGMMALKVIGVPKENHKLLARELTEFLTQGSVPRGILSMGKFFPGIEFLVNKTIKIFNAKKVLYSKRLLATETG